MQSTTPSEYEKPCAHCGTTFRGAPSEVAKRKFCSKACVGASRRGVRKTEWVTINCKHCTAPFQVTPAWVRNGRRSFCSKTCHRKYWTPKTRTGKRHSVESRAKMSAHCPPRAMQNSSQWKGGRFKSSQGYVSVMVEALPPESLAMARAMTARQYILEHRIVAAMTARRPVLKSEIVHHKNGIKDDNRPENLEIVPRAAHSKEHREIERKVALLETEVDRLRKENLDLRSQLSHYRRGSRAAS